MTEKEPEVLQGEVLDAKPRKIRRDRKIRDKMFVDEYLSNGLNATKAAWKVTGATTAGSAALMGHQMLKRNEEAIENKMTKFGLTEELVIKKHKDLVESDNENIAMKAVDTYYKTTKHEANNDQNITVHFNF
jgi:hypothetical protein